MQTYLTHTKFNTYKYQRRVPKQLLQYINNSYFRISLGADVTEATATALTYNSMINEALQLVDLNITDKIIVAKLDSLIPKSKVQGKKLELSKEGLFIDVVSSYLQSQKDNISADETRDKSYFYNDICTYIFKQVGITNNPVLKDINYNHLLNFRNIIIKLPKRNIQKYRTMKIDRLLKTLDNVQADDRISARTVNKYIKWLRALFNFALVRGLITVNLAQALPIQKTVDDKLQRLPLSTAEYNQLLQLLSIEKKYLTKVLKHTGMRLSELYKCTVEHIDDVLCFSLLDRNTKLKTKSSYRSIPIHSSLLNDIDKFENYRCKISSDNIAKSISKLIKEYGFMDCNKKSLYSLRHSFATELIELNAQNTIVSQLLGHSLSSTGGMTMARYSNGYSIFQLQETVELLK
jgi:integrase